MKYLFSLFFLLFSLSLSAKDSIDGFINATLDEKGVQSSELCSDSDFLRRLSLVLTGKLPSPQEVEAFLDDKSPSKRSKMIDDMVGSDAFIDFQVLKWGDLLRIKSEFPSNIWPNGVQAYARWVREHITQNTPYNKFVQQLLISKGSNFRSPAVNFYRAFQDRDPKNIAANVGLIFLGIRTVPQDYSVFFEQVSYKSSNEWKEEFVFIDYDKLPSRDRVLTPSGAQLEVKMGTDFRLPFVEWLTSPWNEQFTKAYVNRAWYWLMGQGIVSPVDDMRSDNKAINPELLNYLSSKFVEYNFDTQKLFKEILNSDAFARSSRSTPQNKAHLASFAYYPTTRLTAEQIIDAIGDFTGIFDRYTSSVPEPYSYYPDDIRAVQLDDGTVSSSQIELFGRPSRDNSLESDRSNAITSKQVLYLLNSAAIINKIKNSEKLKTLSNMADRTALMNQIYLMTIGRRPTEKEVDKVLAISKRLKNNKEFTENLVWAMLNSTEFLFNH